MFINFQVEEHKHQGEAKRILRMIEKLGCKICEDMKIVTTAGRNVTSTSYTKPQFVLNRY